jgi:hypothetical protein
MKIRHEMKMSHNFNNKLCCEYFTTIRLSNPTLYYPGNEFEIVCSSYPRTVARIVSVRTLIAENLDEYTCRLDTGCSKEGTIDLLQYLYPSEDVLSYKLDVLLMEKCYSILKARY